MVALPLPMLTWRFGILIGMGMVGFRPIRTAPTLWVVVMLYILLDFIDCIWDPLAEARLQNLIASEARATVSSIVNYAGGLMELLGIVVLALLLGGHSEQLSEIVPDLVTAFSGGAPAPAEAPLTQLGLAVPDLAIVVLIGSALLALPFLLLSARARGIRSPR